MSELKPCPFCGQMPTYDPDNRRASCATRFCPMFDRDIGWDRWNSRAEQWQPIETAPRDGTRVLAFGSLCPRGGRMMVELAYFEADTGAWWIYGEYRMYHTHWMPLPEPPKEQK